MMAPSLNVVPSTLVILQIQLAILWFKDEEGWRKGSGQGQRRVLIKTNVLGGPHRVIGGLIQA